MKSRQKFQALQARARRAAAYRRALARCLDLLERINADEPWTSGDVDALLDELRAHLCKACRDGKPHEHEEAA